MNISFSILKIFFALFEFPLSHWRLSFFVDELIVSRSRIKSEILILEKLTLSWQRKYSLIEVEGERLKIEGWMLRMKLSTQIVNLLPSNQEFKIMIL
jgi:hypothetical protein